VCVCVRLCVCMCAPDICQLDCLRTIGTPNHVPRASRTRIHVARTHLPTTSTTPSRGTQPQYNAGLHAQQLAEPTRSNPQHHAATTTTTTTTNNYDYYQAATRANTTRASTTRPATTRTPPARGSVQPVKHPSNTRQRRQSSKARQLTSCVQADVRIYRPTHPATTRRRVVAVTVVVPRAPSRRTPTTQAAKAPISNFNHHNKRRNNDNNTRRRRRQRSLKNTEVLVVLVVFLGGVSRDS
jgi:hypothetical protein